MSAPAADDALCLGLVGSPNAGKTTIFNALTGLRARVGNYPGVTVERREGRLEVDGRSLSVIDLPGTYSLDPISPDEAVVEQVISGEIAGVPRPDALVTVPRSGGRSERARRPCGTRASIRPDGSG